MNRTGEKYIITLNANKEEDIAIYDPTHVKGSPSVTVDDDNKF